MQHSSEKPTPYVPQPIPFKPPRVAGFAPQTWERIYEDRYGAAIRRLNAQPQPDVATLNEIALHEATFDSIGDDGGTPLDDPALRAAIDSAYGSLDAWKDILRCMAADASDETGWIALLQPRHTGLLTLKLTAASGLSDARLICAFDMHTNALRPDFGEDRVAYISALLDTLHCGRIAARFHAAPSALEAHACSIAAFLDTDAPPHLIDVRHDDDRARDGARITGTPWRDSFNVSDWAPDCPRDRPVVLYCMYGGWVGQTAARDLRAAGVDARFLEGGIAAWRAMGLPCEPD